RAVRSGGPLPGRSGGSLGRTVGDTVLGATHRCACSGDGQLEVARRGPRRLRAPRVRQGTEVAPVDPVALDQAAHVFAREAGVVGRTLDAAPVATELGDQVALLERRDDALARHAKGKIEVL